MKKKNIQGWQQTSQWSFCLPKIWFNFTLYTKENLFHEFFPQTFVQKVGITVQTFFYVFSSSNRFWAILCIVVKNAKHKKLRLHYIWVPKCTFFWPQLKRMALVWYLLNSSKSCASSLRSVGLISHLKLIFILGHTN